ncbi:hypothetical protein LE197_05850 [Pseudomonas sp. PS1(2021)]|uniref:Uncharacterized protein n=1 Tax=Pseudomonas putida TaxID=303 RepID=A0A1L7NF62_PSEPU|nr:MULTISPECIES: hypothetical protein [Pseudomonas]UCM29432.1 hypothetical protein LE197_05850 [Pseudomonas sp. PS1(2021)]BAW24100.1 Uncharacterized protein KF715C_ch35270 [Pseudomonas putida]
MKQVPSHSFSGRLGFGLGKVWRILISKIVSSQSSPQRPRSHFLVMAGGKLLCLLGLAAVALTFSLLIITNLVVTLIRSWWDTAERIANREESVPDALGADLYIGDYDSNGHYIGDFKSPD